LAHEALHVDLEDMTRMKQPDHRHQKMNRPTRWQTAERGNEAKLPRKSLSDRRPFDQNAEINPKASEKEGI
jgi:hypothetical protein